MYDAVCPTQALHAAAAEVKTHFPHIIIESSGGVTEDTLNEYMGPNVDVISLSKTTQVSWGLHTVIPLAMHPDDPHLPKCLLKASSMDVTGIRVIPAFKGFLQNENRTVFGGDIVVAHQWGLSSSRDLAE